ncbi:discoidin domain-containing protein [Alteromonas sp. CYL-A6]|uniref:discoidin domain-containing protein n=1 Tax=Alteromonas nitratireducens TaxID=3390813 RepID=UPI0034AB5D39
MIRFFKNKHRQPDDPQSLLPEDMALTVNRIRDFVKANPIVEFKGTKSNAPLEVKTSEKGRFVRFSLQTEVSFHLDAIEIFNRDGRNIAPNKKTIISSVYNDEEKYDGRGALNGKKNGGCGFHTQREKNPWLVVDLKTIRNLDKIVVYNREGTYFTRALSLKIEVSKDLRNWTEVYDNWRMLNEFKKQNPSEFENAVLHAFILDPAPSQALLSKLKKAGSHNQALAFQKCISDVVKEQGLAFGPHGFMRTFELRSQAEKNKVAKELGNLLHWINHEFGVPAFISSGTLLGIVRDGKFIDHDDDVDICYVGKAQGEHAILEERERLVSFLREKGCRVAPSGIAHYWCTTPGGQGLDIFTGFIEGEKCSMNPISRNEIDVTDVLPLKQIEHDGATLYMPANPERLLEVNYGPNWRKPDPLWSFNWKKAKQDFAFLYF